MRGFRDRVLDECLAAMRRVLATEPYFWVLYRGLEPTTAENLRRLPQLLAVLEAPQSALISFALDTLAGTVPAMNTEQAASLVDASHAVLYRTEKKVLRAQLPCFAESCKNTPGIYATGEWDNGRAVGGPAPGSAGYGA